MKNPFSGKDKPFEMTEENKQKKAQLKKDGILSFHDAEDLTKKGIVLIESKKQALAKVRDDMKRERISEHKENKKNTADKKKNLSRSKQYAEEDQRSWEEDITRLENKQQTLSLEFAALAAKEDLTSDEEDRMEKIVEETEEVEEGLKDAKKYAIKKKVEAIGLASMEHGKNNPTVIDKVYGEHTGTDGTKSGEQRQTGKAEKSNARINFENKLKEVGDLQEKYLLAYEDHFNKMSEPRKKFNRFLENIGRRKMDKVQALKEEREGYENAKASLLNNLKEDLMKPRTITRDDGSKLEKEGLDPDQAERVAAKYVEKVLNIETLKKGEEKLIAAKNEAFKNVLAREEADAKKWEHAHILKKIFLRNWKLRLTTAGIGAAATIATGGAAGIYFLHRIAGMVGGYFGGQLGKDASGFFTKKYGSNPEESGKKFDKVTAQYLEGKMSVTEYQKKLEKLGLDKRKIQVICAMAGGMGGGILGGVVENNTIDSIHHVDTPEVSQTELTEGEYNDTTVVAHPKMDTLPVQNNVDTTQQITPTDTLTQTSPAPAAIDSTNHTAPAAPATVVDHSTPAVTPEHSVLEIKVEKGGGGITMTRALQAKLRAEYPDITQAPKHVQDFVAADAEKLMMNEKVLIYKDGSASSGLIGQNSTMTYDVGTGEWKLHNTIPDTKGVSDFILEDGKTETTETYTGRMMEHHTQTETQTTTENVSSGETSGSPRVITYKGDEGAVEGIPQGSALQETTNTNPSVEKATSLAENAKALSQTTKMDPADTLPKNENITQAAPLEKEIVFSDRIDKTVNILSEKFSIHDLDTFSKDIKDMFASYDFLADLNETGQQEFIVSYVKTVDDLFGYETSLGEHISGFEAESWQDIKGTTLTQFLGKIDGAAQSKEQLTDAEYGLSEFFADETNSSFSFIQNPPSSMTIEEALIKVAFETK